MIEKIRNRHQTLLLFLLDVEGKEDNLIILLAVFSTPTMTKTSDE